MNHESRERYRPFTESHGDATHSRNCLRLLYQSSSPTPTVTQSRVTRRNEGNGASHSHSCTPVLVFPNVRRSTSRNAHSWEVENACLESMPSGARELMPNAVRNLWALESSKSSAWFQAKVGRRSERTVSRRSLGAAVRSALGAWLPAPAVGARLRLTAAANSRRLCRRP
jgi:hypothetical protein